MFIYIIYYLHVHIYIYIHFCAAHFHMYRYFYYVPPFSENSSTFSDVLVLLGQSPIQTKASQLKDLC